MEPRPRHGIYEHYWRFAAERHRVFLARAKGRPRPWTADPILLTYKFCNAYRAADRVTQYLIREVCYSKDCVDIDDLIFQIVAFRTFSHIGTWEVLKDALGRAPTLGDLESGAMEQVLNDHRAAGKKLYTGAFILCATDAYGRRHKHLNHLELFKHMFLLADAAATVRGAGSLQEVYAFLHSFPLMGDFMSYQIAIDLNYSTVTGFSENDFTQPGPGAVRGIKKVFTDLGSLTPSEAIMWMVDHQDEEFGRLNLDFDGLWGRPLTAVDCQNLFCETDKYLRAAAPTLTSGRTKIKAKFTSSPERLPLFFPPKWEINDRLPTVPSGGDHGAFESSQLMLEV